MYFLKAFENVQVTDCTDSTDCTVPTKANWSYWNDLDLYVGRGGVDGLLSLTNLLLLPTTIAVSGANKRSP